MSLRKNNFENVLVEQVRRVNAHQRVDVVVARDVDDVGDGELLDQPVDVFVRDQQVVASPEHRHRDFDLGHIVLRWGCLWS